MKKKVLPILASLVALVGIASCKSKNKSTIADDSSTKILSCELNSKNTTLTIKTSLTIDSLEDLSSYNLVLSVSGEDIRYSLKDSFALDGDVYTAEYTLTNIKKYSAKTMTVDAEVIYTDETTDTADEVVEVEIPTIDTYTQVGDIITFGRYPQSQVSNSSTIESLNTLVGTPQNPEDGYTFTDYNYYVSGATTSYMYYIDVDYDGDDIFDYRGVYFTSYRPTTIDSLSSASNSEQDDNGYELNTMYWFNYDPIEWKVLSVDGDKAYIASDIVLDSQEFYTIDSSESFEHNGYDSYSSNYETSSIRRWLNDTFYNQAFDDVDKAIIEQTTVDNSKSSLDSNQQAIYENGDFDSTKLLGNNTLDYVYLPSTADMYSYYDSNEDRRFTASDYALSQGCYKYSSDEGDRYTDAGDTWTRTPNLSYIGFNSYVTRSGAVYNSSANVNWGKKTNLTDTGVLPAMIIDVTTNELNVSSENEHGSVNLTSKRCGYEEKVNLVATPDDGYTFEGWYDGDTLLSTEASYTYTMPNEDKSIVAKFVGYTLEVSSDTENVNYTASASIVRAGESAYVEYDTLGEDYSFVGWYLGDTLVSTDAKYTFTMPHENVVLSLVTKRYTLTVTTYVSDGNLDSGCSISESSGYLRAGTQKTIDGTLGDGYLFEGWYLDGEMVGTKISKYDFTMPNADCEITGKFIKASYSFTKNISGGYITYNTSDLIYGQSCTVSTNVYDGYTFYGWYDDTDTKVTASRKLTFTVDDNNNYVAKYQETSMTFTTSIANSVKLSGVYGMIEGESNSITATICTGYTFVGWYLGDELVSDSLTLTFTVTTDTVEYVCKCTGNEVTYKVVVWLELIDQSGYGKHTVYEETGTAGSTTSYTPREYEYYTLTKAPTTVIKGDGSSYVSLYYTRDTYTLSYDSNKSGVTSLPSSDTYKVGATIALTYKANSGYTFESYDINGTVLTDSSYVMPANDVTVIINYTCNTDTAYSVAYYLMNKNGGYDNTPAQTISYTGTTDDYVLANQLNLEGFTYESGDGYIAGSGNTVINSYYSRNKYTVYFDVSTPNGDMPDYDSDGYALDSETGYYYRELYYQGYYSYAYFTVDAGYVFGGLYVDGELVEGTDKITKWNGQYEFGYTISEDTVYVLKTSASTNTAYTLNVYRLINVDEWAADNTVEKKYSLTEDYTLYGTTDTLTNLTEADVAEYLTAYLAFDYIVNTTISGDGSSVAVLYTIPPQYTLTIERNYDYGNTIVNSYGSQEVVLYYDQTVNDLSVTIDELPSYVEFSGWYYRKTSADEWDISSYYERYQYVLSSFSMRSYDCTVMAMFSVNASVEFYTCDGSDIDTAVQLTSEDGEYYENYTDDFLIGRRYFEYWTPMAPSGYSLYTVKYYEGTEVATHYSVPASENAIIKVYYKPAVTN